MSSYRTNGQGQSDELITPHPIYLALGRIAAQRKEAYKDLFKAPVDAEALNDIRVAWQTGTPLGNALFKAKAEAKLSCKVGQVRRGRSAKVVTGDVDE